MNIVIVGDRLEGKTSLACSLGLHYQQSAVAFDPRGMINGLVCWGPDELQDAIDAHRGKRVQLVYRYDSEDADQAFSECCSVLFPPRFTLGGFAFIVDEAGQLQTANSCHPALLRVVKQHPTKHGSVTVIQTSHVLGEFHSKSRSLYDELFMFRLEGPNDLDALITLTKKPELWEIVSKLPPHHCVRYMFGRKADGEAQYYIWDDPSVWRIRATTEDDGQDLGLDKPAEGSYFHDDE